MYTLKEAADVLGMTKAGIRYRMNSLGMPINKDTFGRILLSDADLQWLREGKEPESEPESGGKNREETERKPESFGKEPEKNEKNEKEPESNAEAVALAVLREQIAIKDAQIAALTAQLSDVAAALKSAQNALEGAQALHAATMKKQLQEAQEPEPVTVDGAEEQDEPEQKRRGLFGWLRRGK